MSKKSIRPGEGGVEIQIEGSKIKGAAKAGYEKIKHGNIRKRLQNVY